MLKFEGFDRAIRQSNCYHKEGHEAACEYEDTYYMLLFGIVEIAASQIPNIFHTKWLSVIAATMSFTYSFIGMGLELAQVIGMDLSLKSQSVINLSEASDEVMEIGQDKGRSKVASMASQQPTPHKKYGWLLKLLETLHFHLRFRSSFLKYRYSVILCPFFFVMKC